nr:hypothetical protein BgiMline_032911 [Biomphalaria glabrata]
MIEPKPAIMESPIARDQCSKMSLQHASQVTKNNASKNYLAMYNWCKLSSARNNVKVFHNRTPPVNRACVLVCDALTLAMVKSVIDGRQLSPTKDAINTDVITN